MHPVLVLEDNETSRFVIRAVLEQAGLDVVEAVNAEDAIRVCEEHGGRIGLVIADAILRGSNGPEAAKRLRVIAPEVPILFISGFPLEQLVNRGLLRPGELGQANVSFLQKPFLPKALLNKVEDLTHGRE